MSTDTIARPAETGHSTVIELLARVMADISHVGKDGYNKAQSFNFRGIDAVLNAVGPAFRKHGIVPKPILKDVSYEDILVGANRTPMTRCTVRVKYRFKGPGGDFEDVTVPGEAFDSGDKGTAKAMSVAYRIALIQLLALPTTEPDPDESSYERAPAAVTDQHWLAAVQQRIAAATDHDALTVIGADIGAQADAGQLGTADGARLRAEFDARWAALAPQDRPAQRHRGPVDDEWNTVPPQAVADQQDRDAEAPQDRPLPPPAPGVPNATGKQIGEIVQLLGVKRGVYNDQCAGAVAQLVRRPVEDPRTLSQAEARSIIETLTGEKDLVPLPTMPEPAPAADGPPTRMAIEAQKKMMWATITKQGHTHDGGHVLMSRILRREITSTNQLTYDDATTVINALGTGEIPPPLDPEPTGPDSVGGGIAEFDALDQMILDVTSDEARAEVEQAITVEVGRGTITAVGAGVLRKRLAEHVAQAKAGASA